MGRLGVNMTNCLETNNFEQGNNSKDNYEKLREFFKERIKILKSKGLISKDILEENDG